MKLKHTLISLFTVSSLISCKGQPQVYNSPPGYNFHKPEVIRLPEELNEISGIAYYHKDNSIFCESDAKGQLYKIPLTQPLHISKWKFGHGQDYEDLVLHDSTFYILNSNGDITTLRFQGKDLKAEMHEFPDKAKQEFESLYYDKERGTLVMVCKDCNEQIKTSTQAYTVDTKQFVYSGAYTIDASRAITLAGNKSTRLKPSAVAIHPVTGELYILTSVNRALMVANRNGAIKEVYPLDPAQFQHPEGLTFTPEGNMFISNEADDPKPANILFFQYKKPVER